jgi:hypothetical protein
MNMGDLYTLGMLHTWRGRACTRGIRRRPEPYAAWAVLRGAYSTAAPSR